MSRKSLQVLPRKLKEIATQAATSPYYRAKMACRLIIAVDAPLLYLMGCAFTAGQNSLGFVLMGVLIFSSLLYFELYIWIIEQRTE